jgi:hypothetical protein
MKKLQASALSSWLGRQVPCLHTISQHGWPEQPLPPQFNLSTPVPPEIAFTVFEGDRTLTPLGGRSTFGHVENEIEDTPS